MHDQIDILKLFSITGKIRQYIQIHRIHAVHPPMTSMTSIPAISLRCHSRDLLATARAILNRNIDRVELRLPPLPLRVLRIVLIEIMLVLPPARLAPPGAVPEMIRVARNAIRRRDDLNEVPARDLDRRDLGRGQPDEVREHAPDDGGVPDDEEVFLLALELDQGRFEADCDERFSMWWEGLKSGGGG